MYIFIHFLLISCGNSPHTHHNDSNTNANPTNDVQPVVEHLVDGSRTALKTRRAEEGQI